MYTEGTFRMPRVLVTLSRAGRLLLRAIRDLARVFGRGCIAAGCRDYSLACLLALGDFLLGSHKSEFFFARLTSFHVPLSNRFDTFKVGFARPLLLGHVDHIASAALQNESARALGVGKA